MREESRSLQPNLTDDDDCDDDIADHNESVVMSNAENKAYLESNNSKKHLFLMCLVATLRCYWNVVLAWE